MSLVGGRIDVFMLEGVGNVAGHIDAGNLASPKEVPVFFNLKQFVPMDRLQNVTVGDEAIADVVAPANRTTLFQNAAMDTETTTIASQQSRTLFIVAQGSRQIDVAVLVELVDQLRKSCSLRHRMIVIGEDNDRRPASVKQSIATGGQTDNWWPDESDPATNSTSRPPSTTDWSRPPMRSIRTGCLVAVVRGRMCKLR